jgi:hypothetical protein
VLVFSKDSIVQRARLTLRLNLGDSLAYNNMAREAKNGHTTSEALINPLRGLTRAVSDGFYGASYIPDQSGEAAHGLDERVI